MHVSRIASIICAAGLLALPATANATVTHFNFTGIITASDDFTHIGDTFSGKFSYDTDTLPTTTSGYQDLYYNVFDISFKSPLGSASSSGFNFITVTHKEIGVNDPLFQVFAFTVGDFYLTKLSAPLPISVPGSHAPANLSGRTFAFEAEGSRGPFDPPRSFQGTVTTSVAAVPETATWAMLLAGFCLTGAVLRRRRPVIATRVTYA